MVESTTKGRFVHIGFAGWLARSGPGWRGRRGGRGPYTALEPRRGHERFTEGECVSLNAHDHYFQKY